MYIMAQEKQIKRIITVTLYITHGLTMLLGAIIGYVIAYYKGV